MMPSHFILHSLGEGGSLGDGALYSINAIKWQSDRFAGGRSAAVAAQAEDFFVLAKNLRSENVGWRGGWSRRSFSKTEEEHQLTKPGNAANSKPFARL